MKYPLPQPDLQLDVSDCGHINRVQYCVNGLCDRVRDTVLLDFNTCLPHALIRASGVAEASDDILRSTWRISVHLITRHCGFLTALEVPTDTKMIGWEDEFLVCFNALQDVSKARTRLPIP